MTIELFRFLAKRDLVMIQNVTEFIVVPFKGHPEVRQQKCCFSRTRAYIHIERSRISPLFWICLNFLGFYQYFCKKKLSKIYISCRGNLGIQFILDVDKFRAFLHTSSLNGSKSKIVSSLNSSKSTIV